MIFDTIAPIHRVFDGLEDSREYIEVSWGGCLLLVEPLENGREGQLVRLISSDPADFLRLDLAPGTIVPLS
jgi:hypothetical protein